MTTEKNIIVVPEELVHIGNNVKAVQVGNHLVIIIDLDETIGMSGSGKMMGIASTGGFTPLSHVAKSDRGKAVSGNIWVGEK